MLSVSAALYSKTSFYSEAFQSRNPQNEQAQQDERIGRSFNQGLKRGLGVELGEEQKVNPASKLFDVDKVVDTVMQFVEKRIAKEQANGATDAELESLFDAARSGVETGFVQAREQIDALGRLDDTLSERIDSAETGIYQGIDDLQEKTLAPESVVTDLPASPVFSAQSASAAYSSKESFDFRLTTQDGDRVSISFSRESAAYIQAGALRSGDQEVAYRDFGADFSSAFDLKVKGELDDDELLAIENLLTQVDSLAEEFYNGDLDKAFEMALSLESDASEIARFSLNLTQQQSVASQYSSYQSRERPYVANALPRGLAQPLGDFASGVREAFQEASRFDQPRALLEQLFEQFDAQSRMPNLLQPILDQLELA